MCPATCIPIIPACGAKLGADEGIFSIGHSHEHQTLWMAGEGEQGRCGRDAHELIAQRLEQSLGRKDPGPCIESVCYIKPSVGKIWKG